MSTSPHNILVHPFEGFPHEGIAFLRDLSANNHKAWFEAHKAIYQDYVQKPAVSLVITLGERLKQHFPDITYDTRTNGSGSLMRLHRDTRFSADKSPYKTNVAMMFPSAGAKKMEAAGFGLQLTPHSVELVAGIFSFSKPQLELYRQAVLSTKHAAALERAINIVRSAGDYVLGEPTHKRVPKGYDAAHPHAEWLKYTGLHVYSPTISLDIAQTPELVEVVMAHFIEMSPIQRWLHEVL